jgi:hypothetical protein
MLIRSLARSIRAITLGCLSLFVGGLLVVWLGLWALALKSEREVDRAWGRTRESLSQLAKRFPASESNQAAAALPELSAAIGIDLSSPDDPRAVKPSKAEQAKFDAIRGSLSGHLDAQLRRPDDRVDSLPGELAAYFVSHDAAFSAIRRHLAGAGALRWRQTNRDVDSSIPPLRGILQLERALLCDALERWRRGDRGGAHESIEASWSLVESLGERRWVLSELIGIAGGNFFLGALRKVESPALEWHERFSRLPTRDSLLTALEWQALVETQWAQRGAPFEKSSVGEHVLQPFRVPYTRLCIAGFAENLRRVVAELHREDLCRYDARRAKQIWDRSFPAWNRLGHIVWPEDPYGHPWRLFFHALQRELTLRVLEAKETLASTGAWPVPSIDPECEICPGRHWHYEVSDTGSLTISLDGAVEVWPKYRGVLPPLEFCSGGHTPEPPRKGSRRE